ncbi:MAG: hypothetical protein OXC00_05820 [Acidimicrobiaceae bacterium]|nr:hypothetical protein [Acidimicrobiaceae bacterium]
MQELEAVAAVRDTLARVIADGSHSDRSHAIEAIQAIDRGWEDDRKQYSVTFRLAKVCDARFSLLGSFRGNTDELPSGSSRPMQASLYAIDHLANVLLTRLAAVGVAIYPTMDAPSGEMLELPRAEQDPLLRAIEQDPGSS